MQALAGVVPDAAEGRICAVALRELWTILLAEGAHQSIGALLSDLTSFGRILIALTIIEALGVVF